MNATYTPESLTELLDGTTEGPWIAYEGQVAASVWSADGPIARFGHCDDVFPRHQDASLIAAAPELARQLKAALERERRVRELHKPEKARYFGADLNPDRPEDCVECGEGTAYPCRTIRALDGEDA